MTVCTSAHCMLSHRHRAQHGRIHRIVDARFHSTTNERWGEPTKESPWLLWGCSACVAVHSHQRTPSLWQMRRKQSHAPLYWLGYACSLTLMVSKGKPDTTLAAPATHPAVYSCHFIAISLPFHLGSRHCGKQFYTSAIMLRICVYVQMVDWFGNTLENRLEKSGQTAQVESIYRTLCS